MGLLKTLLILSIAVFPLGAVFRINLITSSYIYPIDIFLFLILILSVYYYAGKKEKLTKSGIFKALSIFIVFAFISLALNIRNLSPQNFLVSFLYIARFILYSNLLFVFNILDESFSKKYRFYLAISGFVVVFLGFIQYFFYPNLRNLYYLGWDDHLYRMFSSFLDPNFAGSIFVLELILLLGLLFQENIFRSKILLLGVIFTSIAIFLTYSRSTFLMFLSATIAFLIITKKTRIIFAFILLLVIAFIFLPKDLKSEGVDLTRRASIVARSDSYRNALIIFQDSPIYGIGFNAYRYSQEKHGFLGKNDWQVTHSGAGVSNSFLFILATTGIIGFILYVNFWHKIIQKTLRSKKLITKAILISSLIGLFVHSIFENTLFYPFIMFWIFSLIGSFKVDT